MKSISIIFLLLISFNGKTQNVGIGNTSPAEKLDVTGNINVTGTIKANGVDGSANQVLMKNNSGVMEWGDVGEFKNFLTYYSNGSFTVPAGVTRIMVELWGGGGGGNWYCGGGGGGYVKAVLTVSAGSVCTIKIGAGGLYATGANAGGGGSTSILAGSLQYVAEGGGGAIYVGTARYDPGVGGASATTTTAASYIVVSGERGGFLTKKYEQYSPTIFYQTTTGGRGGSTFKHPESGGDASHNIAELTETTTKMTNVGSTDGKVPGGGGASGLVSAASVLAGSGAKGMAVVYY